MESVLHGSSSSSESGGVPKDPLYVRTVLVVLLFVAVVGAAVLAVVYGYRYYTRAKAAADRGQPRRNRPRTRGRKAGAAPKHRHYQLLGAENGGLAAINADAVDCDFATIADDREDDASCV